MKAADWSGTTINSATGPLTRPTIVLRKDYAAWEGEKLTPAGLFWQRDVSDGMESSISGGRKVQNLSPAINSYMYANARAIAAIARSSSEQIGYTPWYFEMPEKGRGYEVAWKQLMDPQGFYAPYGLTTAERRHPEFQIADKGDDCQWNHQHHAARARQRAQRLSAGRRLRARLAPGLRYLHQEPAPQTRERRGSPAGG